MAKFVRWMLVGALAAFSGCVWLAGARFAPGPWDLPGLFRTPTVYPVEMPVREPLQETANIKKIFLEGEPCQGRPTRVFAWYGLPEGASASNRVPAMVLVHGGGGTAFAYWVKIWNRRGYAAIAVDTCGRIPDGTPNPWAGPSGWHPSVSQVNRDIRDQWTYHAVAAVIRSHSFVRSLPEVDPDRIGLTGISWGGYLTSIVSSLDPRFRFAAPVYGCGYYGMNQKWRELMGGDAAAFARWLELWDPSVYLPNGSGVPMHWLDGTNDMWYPLDALRASYELLPENRPLGLTLKLRMPHGHPAQKGGTDSGDPREVAALADAYLKGGRPLVEVTESACAGDELRVRFDAHGRTVARAELLYTLSSNPLLRERAWEVSAPLAVDTGRGEVVASVPKGAVMCFVNLVDADGLVVSSRIFQPSIKE